MQNIQHITNSYIEFCKYQKKLSEKTIKAYALIFTNFQGIWDLLKIGRKKEK